MGVPVWKRINVVGPRAVNGLNVAGYGRSGLEKSWTVPSLTQTATLTCKYLPFKGAHHHLQRANKENLQTSFYS